MNASKALFDQFLAEVALAGTFATFRRQHDKAVEAPAAVDFFPLRGDVKRGLSQELFREVFRCKSRLDRRIIADLEVLRLLVNALAVVLVAAFLRAIDKVKSQHMFISAVTNEEAVTVIIPVVRQNTPTQELIFSERFLSPWIAAAGWFAGIV